jgi:hypothetical protein
VQNTDNGNGIIIHKVTFMQILIGNCYGSRSFGNGMRSIFEKTDVRQNLIRFILYAVPNLTEPDCESKFYFYCSVIGRHDYSKPVYLGNIYDENFTKTKAYNILSKFHQVLEPGYVDVNRKSHLWITFFILVVVISFAIIAAANIISWANIIKIALPITAKAGIAAAGIIFGGVLLFFANMLKCKKNIFNCPCDEFCKERCARGENSAEESLANQQSIT